MSVLGITLCISCVVNFLHYIHMFQLNSYHAVEQFRWIGINIKSVMLRHIFTVGAVLMFVVFGDIRPSTCLFAAAFLWIGLIFSAPKKAKKKLVFTPRVIRMTVTSAIVYIAVILLVLLLVGSGSLSFGLIMTV